MRRAYVLFLLLIAGASLAYVLSPVRSASAAVSPVRFGIGDQHTAMFDDPRWQALGLRITRYNVPWDAPEDPVALAVARDFVEAARDHDVQVLLQITGRTYDDEREPLPSRAAYGRNLKKLIAIFRPLGVTTWGVWNEANHPTEATFGRPDRAAQFFLEMHADCTGCTINALDLLTQGTPRSKGVASYRGYTQRFFAALGKKASLVKIIGIHNYGELLTTGGAGISRDLTTYARRWNKRLRFWITESGGIASNRSRTCDEERQRVGEVRMFSHAAALAKNGVDRLYAYNWTADDCGYLFDSGLIRADGTARPALKAVQTGARNFSR
ncbi:MAG: hypothetical protein AAGC46_18160 [Solirubrobacteraceae bacterium]|nr:hypothetical protein [Patulibacter sp.]